MGVEILKRVLAQCHEIFEELALGSGRTRLMLIRVLVSHTDLLLLLGVPERTKLRVIVPVLVGLVELAQEMVVVAVELLGLVLLEKVVVDLLELVEVLAELVVGPLLLEEGELELLEFLVLLRYKLPKLVVVLLDRLLFLEELFELVLVEWRSLGAGGALDEQVENLEDSLICLELNEPPVPSRPPRLESALEVLEDLGEALEGLLRLPERANLPPAPRGNPGVLRDGREPQECLAERAVELAVGLEVACSDEPPDEGLEGGGWEPLDLLVELHQLHHTYLEFDLLDPEFPQALEEAECHEDLPRSEEERSLPASSRAGPLSEAEELVAQAEILLEELPSEPFRELQAEELPFLVLDDFQREVEKLDEESGGRRALEALVLDQKVAARECVFEGVVEVPAAVLESHVVGNESLKFELFEFLDVLFALLLHLLFREFERAVLFEQDLEGVAARGELAVDEDARLRFAGGLDVDLELLDLLLDLAHLLLEKFVRLAEELDLLLVVVDLQLELFDLAVLLLDTDQLLGAFLVVNGEQDGVVLDLELFERVSLFGELLLVLFFESRGLEVSLLKLHEQLRVFLFLALDRDFELFLELEVFFDLQLDGVDEFVLFGELLFVPLFLLLGLLFTFFPDRFDLLLVLGF